VLISYGQFLAQGFILAILTSVPAEFVEASSRTGSATKWTQVSIGINLYLLRTLGRFRGFAQRKEPNLCASGAVIGDVPGKEGLRGDMGEHG
jgi:hypothetical protein